MLDVGGKIIENYKGYTIVFFKKQDNYMKHNNFYYLAYDEQENFIEGAETLEEIKTKIDRIQSV